MSQTFELPPLPYAMDALAPHISKETLEYHYGKHHATYVTKLNGMIEGTEYAGKSLKDIMLSSEGGVFNNAAQAWNHEFYWNCLGPNAGGEPNGDIAGAISDAFGSFEEFKTKFNDAAAALFGSGWMWVVLKKDKNIDLVATQNAGNPLTDGVQPLLVCDVWEHAYYIDYRNRRPDYLASFWNLINWDFVNQQYHDARKAIG
ncbi:superoxide dismutase [Kaarinaea lacus]